MVVQIIIGQVVGFKAVARQSQSKCQPNWFFPKLILSGGSSIKQFLKHY